MKNAVWRWTLWACALTAMVILGFGGMNSGMCRNIDDDPHQTGLRAPTPEEVAWQNKHMTRVKKVKLNKLGLERVNQWRMQQGLLPLTEADAEVVEKGNETEGSLGEALPGEVFEGDLPQAELPPDVDNSDLIYFPPIRSQGAIGSCACFSSTYYTMTHMYAWQHEIDAKNGGDTTRFSPKWTYNMINGGGDNGSWFSGAYSIALKNGPATWAEFPYDSDYREWCLDKNVWRNAIDRRFDQTGYVYDLRQNSGIESLKAMLNNGYVLNFATYVSSWQYTTIKDDPATSADDAFVGKACAFWVNGTSGGHGMTVVGYHDEIWVDINGNGSVDSGEKGAFRIANSWGTGWREGGFTWFAYDGLKNPSAVAGGPSANRGEGWWYGKAYWITPRGYVYQPAMVAEFTLNHLKRSQLRMSLGISDTTHFTPTATWTPAMIYAQGGLYAFDGSTTAVDGSFVFDFTDIAPSGAGGTNRYYLGVYDSASGDPALLSAYQLIDVANGNIATACYDLPLEVDAGQAYAYVDYYYDDGNLRPTAVAYADPTSGQAPLLVNFDGSGSSDPDGTLVSFAWNFGDGINGSGQTISHEYDAEGDYIATLTVTDDKGATHADAVSISVSPPPPKAIYVSDIVMGLVVHGKNTAAEATVYILDEDGAPVAGAAVSGVWSGLVSGSASGTTGGGGSVVLVSANSKSTGTFTITVSGVSASGYVYDSGLNLKTSASISNGDTPNQKPAANAGPDQTVDLGDPVTLDGSGSSDADGTVVSHAWNFGDGGSATGAVVFHTYAAAGIYTATLTVTDNDGATDTDTASITVVDGSANQPPTANAGSDRTALVGDALSFDASGSSDPDGTIVSFAWNFGDGETATGMTASHAYAAAGSYTVTLTVTDDDGATDTDTAVATISDGSVHDMVVSNITMSPAYKGVNKEMNVTVTVVDDAGHPVTNAAVTGRWGGLFSGTVSGVTGSDGKARFLSSKTKNTGLVSFTIVDVTASGYVYDAAGSVTSASANL